MKRRHFLKGPIPWVWIERAACLPGRALVVGLMLWLWGGMRRRRTVRLSYRAFPSSISRYAIYRGLLALELAGLITVQRQRGKTPVITIVVAHVEPEKET